MPDYTPAPQCFGIGVAMFALALASVLTIRCKHVLPACTVTSIVPMGPIGVCRVSYTYEVASTTYADSMEIDSCTYADSGVNHTVSVCYDTHNPARHEASTNAALLRPGQYILAMFIMSAGIAIAALSACCFGNMWKRAMDDAAAAQQSHRYASVSMAAVVHHPDAAATDESRQPKIELRRSDSAML